MKRPIFNPLDATSLSSSDQESTSSLINEDVGVCPKCKTPMSSAEIANGDTVFHCAGCRVSTPRPDSI